MKNKTNIRRMTQLALLLALLLVMNYTPLGYLPIGPLSLSLLTIPVAIGAMVLGPGAGAFLGAAFGATSFLSAMEGKSAMGAALFAASPARSFVVCVVARILCGLLAGLLYRGVTKLLPGKTKTCCLIGGVATPVLNTIFFMGFLVALYYDNAFVQGLVTKLGASNPFMFVVLLVGVQGLVEAAVCCLVAAAVTVPVLRYTQKGK